MAVVNPPSFMQNVATESANQGRMLLSALSPTPGVVGYTDLKVVQHAGVQNMSVDIPGGAAFIAGTENAVQGTYHVFSDSTVTNPTVAASDPTNPRIDRVVAKVQDAFYSGVTNAWSLAVVTGTPTAGATLVNLNGVGAAPNNSITLAFILVPALSTTVVNANISDVRLFARESIPVAVSTVGPPTTGTYAVGAQFVDKNGASWLCLVAGTPGTWIWAGGGRYRATMTQTSAQAITNSTSTIMNMSVADDDPNSGITLGASSKYTVQVPGKYSVKAAVGWAVYNAAFYISVGIFKNGSEVRRGMTANANLSNNGNNPTYPASGDIVCAVGDTLDLRVFQSSGGTINTQGTNYSTYFDVVLVG